MLRLVLLALLIWSTLHLAGRLVRAYLAPRDPGRFGRGPASGPHRGPAGSAGPTRTTKEGSLRRCITCGVHFAPSEGRPEPDAGFCSEGCRRAAEDGPC